MTFPLPTTPPYASRLALTGPRICIINDDLYPSRWTNTQQTIKTAAALAADGADVEVVLPRPWRVTFDSNSQRRREIEAYYGVHAEFELTQIPGLPRSRLRVDEALHGLVAPIYSLIAGHALVYSRKIVPLAVALASGRYVIFESHRILRTHYPAAYRAIKLLRAHPRFLGVVTNAQLVADAFVDMGFAPAAVTVAHNCYDPADMEPRLGTEAARAALGLPLGVPIVCYAGHIQRRKGIEMVIAMAARTPSVRYLICGGFPHDIADARSMARAMGADNLTFTGWIDVRKLSAYLYASDVLVIPPTSAPLHQFGNTVLPIKTYSYLAAGRAILAPALDDIREVLRHDSNAWLCAPDDLDDAANAIMTLLSQPALRARLGREAEADARQYTWQARARAIRLFIAQRFAAVQHGRRVDMLAR